ncbi:single-stranded DNA-binding protein [Lysobacter firmicutimachus]|uniref:Single-stranded DNA-binding protein n=1 Tax=Lysobacter firmicutimachus TaxID=1792846 RepID=A0ABU8D339_9GAMM
MHVVVKSTTVTNQRPYRDRMYGDQQAALDTGSDYPRPFKLNVEVGKEFQPGRYELAGDSFGNDKHGNLILSRVRLGKRVDTPPPVPTTK